MLFGVFSPSLERRLIRPLAFAQISFRYLQAIAAERRLEQTLIDVKGVIVFSVAGEPQTSSHDHLWAISGAGAFCSVGNHLETITEIGSVHGVTFDAIANRAIDQIVTGELAVVWCRVGVLVVHHHDNERRFFDCGHIYCFMERTGRGPAITYRRCANCRGIPFEASSHQGAGHDRN